MTETPVPAPSGMEEGVDKVTSAIVYLIERAHEPSFDIRANGGRLHTALLELLSAVRPKDAGAEEGTAGVFLSTKEAALRITAPTPSPEPRKATAEEIEAASRAVGDEWRVMATELGLSPAQIARDFVSPTNHRLIKAALNAALAVRSRPHT